jgi:hypothetical protein
MELPELNNSLAKLYGQVWVEDIDTPQYTSTGSVTIRINGDEGFTDNGGIELGFSDVEAMNLPFSMLGPVSISMADEKVDDLFNANYIEPDTHLFIITDSTNIEWWIYAQSYRVEVLPVY